MVEVMAAIDIENKTTGSDGGPGDDGSEDSTKRRYHRGNMADWRVSVCINAKD